MFIFVNEGIFFFSRHGAKILFLKPNILFSGILMFDVDSLILYFLVTFFRISNSQKGVLTFQRIPVAFCETSMIEKRLNPFVLKKGRCDLHFFLKHVARIPTRMTPPTCVNRRCSSYNRGHLVSLRVTQNWRKLHGLFPL